MFVCLFLAGLNLALLRAAYLLLAVLSLLALFAATLLHLLANALLNLLNQVLIMLRDVAYSEQTVVGLEAFGVVHGV